MARLLLAHGADADSRSAEAATLGQRALQRAAAWPAGPEELEAPNGPGVERGADPRGCLALIGLLLEHGASGARNDCCLLPRPLICSIPDR